MFGAAAPSQAVDTRFGQSGAVGCERLAVNLGRVEPLSNQDRHRWEGGRHVGRHVSTSERQSQSR
jgi:hypothetical protein